MRDAQMLGRRLHERRAELGLSQRELAGDDLSSSYVSLIESGRRWPTLDVLEVLAGRLQTTTKALVDGSVTPVRTGDEIDLDLKWAKIALRAGNPESAEKYARKVLEDVACAEGDRLDALSLIAAATEGQGRLNEAIDILEPLVDELDADTSRELWLTCQVMLCRCYMDVGDLGHAIDLGERALGRFGDVMRDEEIMLAISLSGAYNERGDVTRASRLLSMILSRSEVAGSHRNRGAALWNASIVADADGRMDDAVRLSDQALALFSESDAVRNLGRLRVTCAHLLREQSATHVAQARDHLARASEEFEMEGTVIERARCLTELARCALDESDLDEAERLVDQATEVIEGGPEIEHAHVQLVRGHVLLRNGAMRVGLRVARGAAIAIEHADSARQAARAWREVAALARVAENDALTIEALERAVGVLGVRPTRVGTERPQPASLPVNSLVSSSTGHPR